MRRPLRFQGSEIHIGAGQLSVSERIDILLLELNRVQPLRRQAIRWTACKGAKCIRAVKYVRFYRNRLERKEKDLTVGRGCTEAERCRLVHWKATRKVRLSTLRLARDARLIKADTQHQHGAVRWPDITYFSSTASCLELVFRKSLFRTGDGLAHESASERPRTASRRIVKGSSWYEF